MYFHKIMHFKEKSANLPENVGGKEKKSERRGENVFSSFILGKDMQICRMFSCVCEDWVGFNVSILC
jgi:hypothetical protein